MIENTQRHPEAVGLPDSGEFRVAVNGAAAPPTAPQAPRPCIGYTRCGSARASPAARSRKLKLTAVEVAEQERETTDLRLSQLYRWQEAIEVPLPELLLEDAEEASLGIQLRARMVRIMRTVRSISQRSRQSGIRRLAQNLAELLEEMMPELDDVKPWPAKGRLRRRDDFGEALRRGRSIRVRSPQDPYP